MTGSDIDTGCPPELLVSVLGRYATSQAPEGRPFVTLTFAQSIDAKIAGQHGKQLILSGRESMIMTHWMRTMHDAILVGIGTALNDDPQLNTRYLPPPPDGSNPRHLPRPVVIDRDLRLSPTCKLLRNYRSGQGRRPWVLCAPRDEEDWYCRSGALEAAGATVVKISGIEQGATNISISAILRTLHQMGICSLMVEGGARIIASFFAERSPTGRQVIDSVIVTVAPTFVGGDGLSYGIGQLSLNLRHVRTDRAGNDIIMAFAAE